MTDEQIAQHIYQVIRALNLECGVPYPRWESAPEENKTTFINGVRYHLDNPEITPAETHDWWMQDKAEKGWTYGEVKNEDLKQHPSMVPFSLLSDLERGKDVIFIELCRIFGQMRSTTISA